jgi:hypothetical protein
MDSNLSASSFNGAQHTQFSAAQNHHTVKDPLDYYYKEKGGNSENGGFWKRFIFHEQVQDTEMELQYLNATKSDHGGTSVGVSDAKLRFLGLKSYGIINVAFISLVLNLLIFFILFNFAGQLLAFIFSLIMFIHVLFPGYVIYGMKRFTTKKGKFTTKYYQKIKAIWRLFELIFLTSIGAVFYLTTINYSQKIELLKEMTTNKVFLKLIKITTSKINFEQLQGMFKVYLLIMLITFLVYIIVIYIRKKSSHKVQKEIEFEHNKEIKRPAELARIRMGKLKN